MVDQPAGLGPVQLVIIAFDGGRFDGRILAELRRLREHDTVRLVDLLFVAKGDGDEVIELVMSDLPTEEAAEYGALVRALMGVGVGGEVSAAEGARTAADAASRNGLLPGPENWFLADRIPPGASAAVALLEHRWAVPLRDAIEAAAGHDLVDTWVHPEDLVAIGAALD